MEISSGKKLALATMVAVAAVFSSCSKDNDEVAAAYEGKWVSEQTEEDGLLTKSEATITKSTFEMKLSEQRSSESKGLVNYMNLKGSLTVAGNLMTVSFTEISTLGEDNTMTTFKKGDAGFDIAIKAMDGKNKFTYRVEGDKLTLSPVVSATEDIMQIVFTRVK